MNARWLLVAILLTIFLSFLPFAHVVTYPFLIFSTFVHETSHALAAILTGGSVESLIVRMDGSGVTYTRGGLRLLVSSAGYIGTTLIGGFLLILSARQRNVRPVLIASAISVFLITAIFVGHTNNLIVLALILLIAMLAGWSMRQNVKESNGRMHGLAVALGFTVLLVAYLVWTKSLFSWAAGLLITFALFAVARFASITLSHFFLTFLAVQCSLNALDALKTVYFLSMKSTCGNDAANMAAMTGIPAWIWASAWVLLSLLLLAISAAFYLRNSLRGAPASVSAGFRGA